LPLGQTFLESRDQMPIALSISVAMVTTAVRKWPSWVGSCHPIGVRRARQPSDRNQRLEQGEPERENYNNACLRMHEQSNIQRRQR